MATIGQVLRVKGPDVIVASPGETVLAASKLMAEANVGSVIIKDGEAVKGIFTERDLLTRVIVVGKDPAAVTLAEMMSAPVRICRLDDNVHSVFNMMVSQHISHVAVVEGGALIGLVGLRDILSAELQEAADKLKEYEPDA
jgi:CBS domain-containing protein